MVKAALTIYEDSLCACGHSMALTQASDAIDAYKAETVTCPACAAREREREQDHGPGRITMVRDLRDTPAADLEDDYEVRWMPGPDDVVQLRSAGGSDLVADGEGVAERLDVEGDIEGVTGPLPDDVADV